MEKNVVSVVTVTINYRDSQIKIERDIGVRFYSGADLI